MWVWLSRTILICTGHFLHLCRCASVNLGGLKQEEATLARMTACGRFAALTGVALQVVGANRYTMPTAARALLPTRGPWQHPRAPACNSQRCSSCSVQVRPWLQEMSDTQGTIPLEPNWHPRYNSPWAQSGWRRPWSKPLLSWGCGSCWCCCLAALGCAKHSAPDGIWLKQINKGTHPDRCFCRPSPFAELV